MTLRGRSDAISFFFVSVFCGRVGMCASSAPVEGWSGVGRKDGKRERKEHRQKRKEKAIEASPPLKSGRALSQAHHPTLPRYAFLCVYPIGPAFLAAAIYRRWGRLIRPASGARSVQPAPFCCHRVRRLSVAIALNTNAAETLFHMRATPQARRKTPRKEERRKRS